MKRENWYRVLLITLLVGVLLLLPVIIQAQDDDGAIHESEVEAVDGTDTPATDSEPEGVGVLILLLGLGGVTIVGGVMIGRDTFGDDGNRIVA